MIEITQSTATLLGLALAANFVIGVYHYFVMLDGLRGKNIPAGTAIIVGLAYVSPPALIVFATARIAGII